MVRLIRQSVLLGAGMLLLTPVMLPAQEAQQAASAMRPDTAAADSDSAPVPKKKGLFGKVKDVAGNKVVKGVAKGVACTMVPGGQVIAGALDAADSESAGEALGDAAGTAAGSGCMPAGLGAAGLAGGLGASGLAGMAAQAGAAAANSGSADAMGYDAAAGMPAQDQIVECLGLSAEEYAALVNPTGGEGRQLTEAEIQRQHQLSSKIDMQEYQSCMMRSGSLRH